MIVVGLNTQAGVHRVFLSFLYACKVSRKSSPFPKVSPVFRVISWALGYQLAHSALLILIADSDDMSSFNLWFWGNQEVEAILRLCVVSNDSGQ